MAENSKIEWTDHTFNPWTGCQKVGPGCVHCYAEGWAKRSGLVKWGPHAERRLTSEANWRKPKKWDREAAAAGKRARVFCASLADVFDNAADPMWRRALADLINDTPALDWLLLTKRIGNARDMLDAMFPICGVPANVWLGATVVNQAEYDRDKPKLVATKRALGISIAFLSMEPLLGAVDVGDLDGLDWIIAGGESGHGARPIHPDWARSLRYQCAAADVAFLFKQWGEHLPLPGYDADGGWQIPQDRDVPPDMRREHNLNGTQLWRRVGKKAAGRLLDGVEHNGFPGEG